MDAALTDSSSPARPGSTTSSNGAAPGPGRGRPRRAGPSSALPDRWLTEWAPLPPGVWLRRPSRDPLPFPLDRPGAGLYALGRHALWHGVCGAGIGPGDEVLVPAYHHGSEIEVLDRVGAACRFYEATERLDPDEEELEALLGPRTRALYLIHHLGFAQDVPRWRRWCDERGLLLIEDAAMAWPTSLDGRPLGSWGDVSIFSPWKTYGLPDLGALVTTAAPVAPLGRARLRPKRLLNGHIDWLAERWGPAARHRWREEPDVDAPYDFEHDFRTRDPFTPPARLSLPLLRRLVSTDADAWRRENYRRLLEALGPRVPPPFEAVRAGDCPFALPLWSADKRRFIRGLRRHGVVGLNLWSRPHRRLPAGRFPAAERLRAGLLGLPCHQGLTAANLARVIDAALACSIEEDHLIEEGVMPEGPDRERQPAVEGRPAPDFELPDQDGNPVRLSSLAGRPVVLYFYPKADTPGCTKQACGLRDRWADLRETGAAILGVTADKPARLRRFADKYALPFTLLSDPDRAVAAAYGAVQQSTRLGVTRDRTRRSTFIIGPDGRLLRAFPDVSPDTHDELVLGALAA